LRDCEKCGSKNIDYGGIETAELLQSAYDPIVYFKSYRKKFLTTKTQLNAAACLDCGHVELYIDVKHLRKRIK